MPVIGYWYVGFCKLETLPSPKDHSQSVIIAEDVDKSVKSISFSTHETRGVPVKSITGGSSALMKLLKTEENKHP